MCNVALLRFSLFDVFVFRSVGTRNYASLPKNAVPTSGNANGFEGWRSLDGKTSENKTETGVFGTRGEVSEGAESRQICRMFCPDAGNWIFWNLYKTNVCWAEASVLLKRILTEFGIRNQPFLETKNPHSFKCLITHFKKSIYFDIFV